MRVAIIHYWLVNWRGGEKVLERLCKLYPEADVYTHVFDRELVAEKLPGRSVQTTFIGRMPGARHYYKALLPLMPYALEALDLSEYDLVISSESGPAKGVITRPDAVHVCYCHSPMRYAWDMQHQYLDRSSRLTRWPKFLFLHRMRMWDQLSAQRVDAFVANSSFVANRIRKCYGRDARVVNPPVESLYRGDSPRVAAGEYYLWVGELVGYKRPDLAVEAFNRTGLPLVVVGEGEAFESTRQSAAGNIRFVGRVSDAEMLAYYSGAKALVFPGVEDFGIVPLEAMSCGTPVIAYGRGGILESVTHGRNGYLFGEQSVDALVDAIRFFERVGQRRLDSTVIRASVERFSGLSFDRAFQQVVAELLDGTKPRERQTVFPVPA